MIFYLGTHETSWLARAGVPLFVSHRRLALRRSLPVAVERWALDSGGFTELSMYGEWRTTPTEYATAVAHYRDEIGSLDWAAPQDWMCEPWMLDKTGLPLEEHQRRTIASYLDLRSLAPSLPFVPVLQGWRLDDYHRHADAYLAAGVDLTAEPTVGLGSVCRRQNTGQIENIVCSLATRGLKLHGFGVKSALGRYADGLVSADSLAWSYRARRSPPLPGCTHRSCANCLRYALKWRERMVRLASSQQLRLPMEAA